MSRIGIFFVAIVVGTLLVGPAVFYAAYIVLFGLGIYDSWYLTHPMGLFLLGARSGFIAALLCGMVRYRPQSSSLWSGLVCLVWLGYAPLWRATQGGLNSQFLFALIGILIVLPLATALMGYLIAILTNKFAEKHPQRTDPATSFAKPQSESRTYVLK